MSAALRLHPVPDRAAALEPELLRLSEVERIVGLRRTAIYRMIGAGQFPRPIKLQNGRSRWARRHIQAWVEAQIAASEA